MVLICSFLLSLGAVICSCATPNLVVWCHDRIRKSTFHHLLWHIGKNICHFWCVQEGPGTHSFGFPSIHWWEFLGPAWHKFSACPVRRSKFHGQFGDSNSTYYWSFCQTSIRPHEIPHFGHIFVHFWRARSSTTRFVFHTLTAIQKCFMPPKNLCPW